MNRNGLTLEWGVLAARIAARFVGLAGALDVSKYDGARDRIQRERVGDYSGWQLCTKSQIPPALAAWSLSLALECAPQPYEVIPPASAAWSFNFSLKPQYEAAQ